MISQKSFMTQGTVTPHLLHLPPLTSCQLRVVARLSSDLCHLSLQLLARCQRREKNDSVSCMNALSSWYPHLP